MICPLMLHLHTRTIIWSVWLRITFVTCAGGRHFTWNVTTACQSCRGNKVSVIDKCVRLSIPHTHWFSSLFVMCCKVAVICNNLPVYHLTFICFCVLPFLHACRVDSPTREVTKAEMRELESSYGVPVLTTANVKHSGIQGTSQGCGFSSPPCEYPMIYHDVSTAQLLGGIPVQIFNSSV